MVSWRVPAVLLLVVVLTSALHEPEPPKRRAAVYFPITPEEFEAYGIKLPQSANPTVDASNDGNRPSTTAKPTTTTERLPIARKSHVAPSNNLVTEKPGSNYLTNSFYYIPGHDDEESLFNQDISGSPSFEDDDRGFDFYDSYLRDKEDELGYDSLGENTPLRDQERFGIFFIGEHESFGGSEEHFREVPYPDYVENESEAAVPQSLEDSRPSYNYGSRVSIEVASSPSYTISQRPPSRYVAPSTTTTTERPYRRRTTTTTERSYASPEVQSDEQTTLAPSYSYNAPRVTLRPRYSTPTTTTQAPTTPRRRYTLPTTTQAPRTTKAPRRYVPPRTTTQRTYTSPRTTSPPIYTAPPARYTTPAPVYTTAAPRYTAPPATPRKTTTTQKPYAVKKSKARKILRRPATESPKPKYSPNRSRARYTPPKTTTTTSRPIRYRQPTTTTARPVTLSNKYRQPTTEAPTHALYFKPEKEPRDYKAQSSRTSYKARQPSYVSKPISVEQTYPSRNLTVKAVSVSSSSSRYQPASSNRFSSRARQSGSSASKSRKSSRQPSRSSSSYKSPSVKTSTSKTSNRGVSKFEAPVYHTSDTSFHAPASLYQESAASLKPGFVKAGNNIYIPQEYDSNAIPGEAGVDYPAYSTVPDTDFECEEQSHPGLYADTDAECQVFHICQKSGQHDSFLCPNGTVFNQQYFVCDWWYNFACDNADDYFGLNQFIYELPETEYRRN